MFTAEFKFGKCGKKFFSQKELKEHIRVAEIFHCKSCKVTFNSRKELERTSHGSRGIARGAGRK